jgi:adenylate cyclase class IV
MNSAAIEVELRGPIEEAAYQRLLNHASKEGVAVRRENRLLIDYSTFIEGIGERTLDVRARITNGAPEIIVKKGRFGGSAREEVAVPIRSATLESAVRLLAMIGYEKGVACDRGISRFSLNGIEFAIQDVRIFGEPTRVHSRFFEAEIVTTPEGKDGAEAKVRATLDELGLKSFGEVEWYAYVETMNREANGVFDASLDDVSKLAQYGQPPL